MIRITAKQLGTAIVLAIAFIPALARAEFKEVNQTVFGMD